MKIAAKEIEETKYWLILCNHSESYPLNEKLFDTINEIGLIIYKIIASSKNNK
jgi:four helix bundle protein